MKRTNNYRIIGIAMALGAMAACSKHPVAATVDGTPASVEAAAVAKPAMTPVTTPAPTPAPPAEASIPAGKSLRVRTAAALSTRSAKAGEHFEAWLAEPVVLDGTTVLPKGARVQGLVAESNPGGRVKGRAVIAIRLTGVEVRGQMMPIQTNTYTSVARGTKSHDAAKIGGGAGVGAAIGAIAGGGTGAAFGALAGAGAGTGVVLATHGAPATIGSESLITFQLRAPVVVRL